MAAAAPDAQPLGPSAMAAARWAWERGESAGADTGTLPHADWIFRPLQGARSRVGVVGVEAGACAPGSDEERLVGALIDQGAVALERADPAASALEAETLRRADQFRSALMNSISHDLRTPLSTVLGSTTTLIEYGDALSPATRADLLEGVREEAEAPTAVFTAAGVTVDLDQRRVAKGEQPVRLSPKEYDLLAMLVRNAGKVVQHRELLSAIWGPAHVHDTQSLRVFIGQLRQKLEDNPAQPALILTEPGVGYRLATAEEG